MMSGLEVNRSLTIGTCNFPQREDYLAAFGLADAEQLDTLNLSPDQVIAIQQDWHSRGQNGCVFAMRAAKTLGETQWSHDVRYELPEPDDIAKSMEGAVEDPENQLHSLIFPNITDSEAVLELIGNAVEAGCVVKEEKVGDSHITRLRWMLGEVRSLILGFAPIDELPPTRRAPFTELLLKTKPKTENIMHGRLDHRRDRTHAADLDPRLMGLSSEQLGSLIDKSETRTARVLGGESYRANNKSARARTTFGL